MFHPLQAPAPGQLVTLLLVIFRMAAASFIVRISSDMLGSSCSESHVSELLILQPSGLSCDCFACEDVPCFLARYYSDINITLPDCIDAVGQIADCALVE